MCVPHTLVGMSKIIQWAAVLHKSESWLFDLMPARKEITSWGTAPVGLFSPIWHGLFPQLNHHILQWLNHSAACQAQAGDRQGAVRRFPRSRQPVAATARCAPPQLRPAAGAASPKQFAGLATIALWRLPCILGLVLTLSALQQRQRRRCSISSASACAGGAGFPFQKFPTMPLVILSIQSSSWASTALIEKILDRARLVPVGPRRV